MYQCFGLVTDSFGHAWVAVTKVAGADTAKSVNESVALCVDEEAILTLHKVNRKPAVGIHYRCSHDDSALCMH
jgi:hypothetical protein